MQRCAARPFSAVRDPTPPHARALSLSRSLRSLLRRGPGQRPGAKGRPAALFVMLTARCLLPAQQYDSQTYAQPGSDGLLRRLRRPMVRALPADLPIPAGRRARYTHFIKPNPVYSTTTSSAIHKDRISKYKSDRSTALRSTKKANVSGIHKFSR